MTKCVQSEMKYNISINFKQRIGLHRRKSVELLEEQYEKDRLHLQAKHATTTTPTPSPSSANKLERKCWAEHSYQDVCMYV